jgi:hypothetical protein
LTGFLFCAFQEHEDKERKIWAVSRTSMCAPSPRRIHIIEDHRWGEVAFFGKKAEVRGKKAAMI